jgi:hypothetical protein
VLIPVGAKLVPTGHQLALILEQRKFEKLTDSSQQFGTNLFLPIGGKLTPKDINWI